MLTTITIIITVLVSINFLLLKFSTNKITSTKKVQQPLILKSKSPVITSIQLSTELSLTGS
jgi:hypothetical protein